MLLCLLLDMHVPCLNAGVPLLDIITLRITSQKMSVKTFLAARQFWV